MFLRPHHFHAAHRYLADMSRRNHNWDLHYNWGLRSIDLDHEALANHRLVIHSLEARLRDGTPVVLPRDGVLPPVDLRAKFREKETRPVPGLPGRARRCAWAGRSIAAGAARPPSASIRKRWNAKTRTAATIRSRCRCAT